MIPAFLRRLPRRLGVVASLVALAWTQAATAATLTSITMAPTNAFIDAGTTQQFTATGHYNDGTAKNITSSVTWSSSAVPVATISGAGLASGNGGGVTTIAATLGTVTGSTPLNVQIPASFFSLSINQINEAWPTTQNVQFMTLRTLGSSIKWADLETCEGGPLPTNPCYDWSRLDTWFDKLQAGQDVLFTLYATPSWASSRGNTCPGATGCTGNPDTNCAFQSQNGPGICDPPKGLNADGTGDDHLWTDFINALYTHVLDRYGVQKIKVWEVWNEPNISTEWNPTDPVNHRYDQLVTMARDAYNVLKPLSSQLLVTTPAVANATQAVTNWLQPYLNAGGGSVADVIAVHGYIQTGACPTNCPVAENVGTLIDNARSVMTATGQQNKPLQDTEASWGCNGKDQNGACISTIPDPDQQAAFTAKFYAVQVSKSVAKFAWYGYDFNGTGEFWVPTNGPLTLAGIAYQQLHQWLTGAVPLAACAEAGTVWTCDYKRAAGQAHNKERLVWDAACTDLTCHTTYSVPGMFTQCVKLDGTACSITAGTTQIGLKPVLLEN
ncbi:MAG TPA: Ig-like domain-containing protein [Thermoanaerobaculia bacterium]|jgi:hypothetical protein|nr:Ig-like domain-containing protein [Thermoanaerobaculia bacterium]